MKKIINPYLGIDADLYNCFACAPHNPNGLKMEFYEDGDDIVCLWTPNRNFEGWHNTLHGGIQATLIDETAGWVISRKFQTSGMTTALNIKYLKSVASGSDHQIEIRACVREVKRTFVFLDVKLMCDGELCSTADVTFYCFSKQRAAEEFLFQECKVEE